MSDPGVYGFARKAVVSSPAVEGSARSVYADTYSTGTHCRAGGSRSTRAVPLLEHQIAVPTEQVAREPANQGVVLDHEDRLAPGGCMGPGQEETSGDQEPGHSTTDRR